MDCCQPVDSLCSPLDFRWDSIWIFPGVDFFCLKFGGALKEQFACLRKCGCPPRIFCFCPVPRNGVPGLLDLKSRRCSVLQWCFWSSLAPGRSILFFMCPGLSQSPTAHWCLYPHLSLPWRLWNDPGLIAEFHRSHPDKHGRSPCGSQPGSFLSQGALHLTTDHSTAAC